MGGQLTAMWLSCENWETLDAKRWRVAAPPSISFYPASVCWFCGETETRKRHLATDMMKVKKLHAELTARKTQYDVKATQGSDKTTDPEQYRE